MNTLQCKNQIAGRLCSYRRALRQKQEAGQVLVIGLFVCVGLFLAAISVANVGMMVAEKIQLQDTVDASAYSAAVVQARYMNLSAYINRAMIANYNNMAFNTAVWAVADSTDHGLAVITALLYQIDAILIAFPITTAFGVQFDQFCDLVRDVPHHLMHLLNHHLNNLFAQDDDALDLNQYIEIYNVDILTMYQGLLYAAMQASRYDVIKEVAERMDPEVLTTSVLGLGAETVSFDEMQRSVDYIIRDPDARGFPFSQLNSAFDRMAGTAPEEDDHPLYLAATTEASLDRFVAGRDRDGVRDRLRNMGSLENIIPGVGAIETAVDIACEAATLSFGDCNSDITLTLGAAMRDGYEDDADDVHVPFIARQRMREVNFFGLDFNISGFPGASVVQGLLGRQGHTSAERHADVGNVANSTVSLADGYVSLDNRASQSIQHNGVCAIGVVGAPSCGLNYMNILQASIMLPASILTPPLIADDHWDGSFDDIEPVDSYQLIPPGTGLIDPVEYQANVLSDGKEIGVPKYDWQVDIDNVGFPYYHYPTTGAVRRSDNSKGGGGDLNLLSGPSIAVIGVKPQNRINGLQGLGIGNPYSMSAIARSQVYYVRNPNRPEETPSLFNPHWVARLAPIDSEDTPTLLKEGLPFVSSIGLGITPTH